MSVKSMLLLSGVIWFSSILFSTPLYSQEFESNGYIINVDWKVKGKYLRLYGIVEDGRPCWKLKIKADMGNRIYDVSADLVTYTGKHNPQQPTVFNAKSDLKRDYKAVKGWFVDELDVYCVGKN